jgi:hypothetical protein
MGLAMLATSKFHLQIVSRPARGAGRSIRALHTTFLLCHFAASLRSSWQSKVNSALKNVEWLASRTLATVFMCMPDFT